MKLGHISISLDNDSFCEQKKYRVAVKLVDLYKELICYVSIPAIIQNHFFMECFPHNYTQLSLVAVIVCVL